MNTFCSDRVKDKKLVIDVEQHTIRSQSPTSIVELDLFFTVHVISFWYNCFRVYFLICSCSVPQVDIIRSYFYITVLSDRTWRSSVFS